MPYTEVGGNGSVHWRVDYEAQTQGTYAKKGKKHTGKDPVKNVDIGVDKGAPSGHFRLEVMYDFPADAQAALRSAVVQGSSLVLFVKANTDDYNNDDDVPAQIRISW